MEGKSCGIKGDKKRERGWGASGESVTVPLKTEMNILVTHVTVTNRRTRDK